MREEQALNSAQIVGLAEKQRPRRVLEEGVVDLYREARPAMLGYLRQIVGSSGEAEDIVQVAFLKLFDQLRKGAELQETRSWLYRVAHNLAIDSLRRQGREESAAIQWMAQRELEDAAVSMEDNMSRRQQVDLLMHGLNERERHCLLLRAEGLSYKEIANVLTISVKAVSVYLSRGLKKFDQKK